MLFQLILITGDNMIFMISAAVISYILGSINPALLISKYIYNKDIRSEGSGNAGATNAVRVLGKKAGAIVFALDFLKGLIAVLAAKCLVNFLNAPYETELIAGLSVQLGHIFPIFFKFKGGKGVATAAGSAAAIMPIAALILLSGFAIIYAATKTVSLASAICAACYPLAAYFLSGDNGSLNFIFAATCSIIILAKHSSNIRRLLNGEEKPVK